MVPVSAEQKTKNKLRQNVESSDDTCRWYLIQNSQIQRKRNGKPIYFDFPKPTKPHPILVTTLITDIPARRFTCYVRSATVVTSIVHYQHIRCLRTCKLNRDGHIDDKWMWSVPESLCTQGNLSCPEPTDSYLFDELEDTNFGSPW